MLSQASLGHSRSTCHGLSYRSNTEDPTTVRMTSVSQSKGVMGRPGRSIQNPLKSTSAITLDMEMDSRGCQWERWKRHKNHVVKNETSVDKQHWVQTWKRSRRLSSPKNALGAKVPQYVLPCRIIQTLQGSFTL